jgi:hypothetical protein
LAECLSEEAESFSEEAERLSEEVESAKKLTKQQSLCVKYNLFANLFA